MTPSFITQSPFRNYWLGDTATVLAYQMLVIAIGWQVYEFTDSPLSLGLIGLAQFLPQCLFVLVAGHVADRYDRRRIALVLQAVQCAIAIALAVGHYTHSLTGDLMYLYSFLIGTTQAFQAPSLRSMLPSLVGPERFPRCLAWCSGSRKVAIVTGPALGGVIFLLGAGAVYLTAAAFFVVAGILLSTARLPYGLKQREPVTLASIFGGIAHIRGNPVVLGAMTLDLFAMLLGGAVALLPIYARDILHTGPWGLGILRAAPAAGALLASVYLVKIPFTRRVGRIMFRAIAVFGVATIVFGLSQNFALSIAALMLSGAADMTSIVIRSSLVQLETPDDKRGRVTAVNTLFNSTANQLGQFESGVTAAWFGTVPAVVIGGMGTLLVVALWIRLFPALANREVLALRTA